MNLNTVLNFLLFLLPTLLILLIVVGFVSKLGFTPNLEEYEVCTVSCMDMQKDMGVHAPAGWRVLSISPCTCGVQLD